MLDLRTLERKLEEALAKETSESLNKWFGAIDEGIYLEYLGPGDYDSLPKILQSISVQPTSPLVGYSRPIVNNTQYAMAA